MDSMHGRRPGVHDPGERQYCLLGETVGAAFGGGQPDLGRPRRGHLLN